MKRLVATTKQTQEFGIDTDVELNLIHEKDPRLNKDNLHNFAKQNNEGVEGGIFYELENGLIHLYVVETFWFKDVDQKAGNEINRVAYVASRLHGDGTLEQPQYVEIKDSTSPSDAKVSNVTIEGMGLVKLQARTLDSARQELATIFDDYTDDKLE